jgi:hypothetical protein
MNRVKFGPGAAAATLAMMAIPGVSVAESFALVTHTAPAGMELGGHLLPPDAARFTTQYLPQGRAPATRDAGRSIPLELVPGDAGDDSPVDATVDWSSLAPYVGMGFGNSTDGGRWSFAFDLGVMFTGLMDFARSGTAQFQVREQFNPEDPFSEMRYYPVLSLGLAYRF